LWGKNEGKKLHPENFILARRYPSVRVPHAKYYLLHLLWSRKSWVLASWGFGKLIFGPLIKQLIKQHIKHSKSGRVQVWLDPSGGKSNCSRKKTDLFDPFWGEGNRVRALKRGHHAFMSQACTKKIKMQRASIQY